MLQYTALRWAEFQGKGTFGAEQVASAAVGYTDPQLKQSFHKHLHSQKI